VTDLRAGSSDPVLRLFDAKAATWSLKYATDGRLTRRLTQFAAAVEQRVSPGSQVLDIGCGTGELARCLAARGYQVTGCDISAEMLNRAEALDNSGGMAWVRLSPGWQALPFESSSFDAVVASSVLEYVEDPQAVLAECARVVRPGGSVLCTVPDPRHPVRWLEFAAAAVASRAMLTVPLSAVAKRSARLGSYVSYLQVSRQRQRHRWWRRTGRQCGLQVDPGSLAWARLSPLRLLTFKPSVTSGQENWRSSRFELPPASRRHRL
jgi:ubiquinone/menaquinone biosynthesis C-methylase UbiE